jgi:hypothetical protein
VTPISRLPATAGQQHTGDRAEGVDRVQAAQPAADRTRLPDQETRQDRQGRAHQQCGQHHQQEDQHEADDRHQRGRLAQQPVQVRVGRLHLVQQQVYQDSRYCNADFEPRVQPQAVRAPVGNAAGQPAAQRHARHETGQHGAHGQRRRAEDVRHHARPDDLVDERQRARPEEQQQNQGQRGAR